MHTFLWELASARLRSSRKTGPSGLPVDMLGPAAQASGSKLPRHRVCTPRIICRSKLATTPISGRGQGPQPLDVEDFDLAITEMKDALGLQVLEDLVGGLA